MPIRDVLRTECISANFVSHPRNENRILFDLIAVEHNLEFFSLIS